MKRVFDNLTGRAALLLAFTFVCHPVQAAAPDLTRPLHFDIPAGNIWTTMEMFKAQAGTLIQVRCNYCSGPRACSSRDISMGSCVPQCPGPGEKDKPAPRACSLPCEALDAITTQAVSGDFPLFDALARMLKGTGVTFVLTSRSDVDSVEIVLVDAQRHFDIAAGPTTTTAMEFTRQSGVRLLMNSDLNERAYTAAVQGYFTPREALDIMLQGSGLTYSAVKSLGDSLFVKEDPVQVLILGRRPTSGVEALAAAPTQTLEQVDLKRSAYESVQEALLTLPAVSRGGPSEVSDPTGSNFGRGASVNLRGLGPTATLVLVNGRRQAVSGGNADFVDVSTIPWAAVRRIVVSSDGASAVYGSDAVAGVVDIIMRDDFTGAETQIHRAASAGGGEETLIAQLFGRRWSTGRFFAAYQYAEREALPASARAYTASSDKSGFGGSDYRPNRSNPGNLLDPATGANLFAIPRGQDGSSLLIGDLQPGATNLQNRMVDVDLLPQAKLNSLYVSAEESLGARLKLQGEGRFSQREILQRNVAADAVLFVPRSNAYFPRGLDAPFALVAYSFDQDLGPLRWSARTRNYTGTLALSADLGNAWSASISRSQAGDDLHWNGSNQVNFSTLASALADSDPAKAFNPFGDGSHTSSQTLRAIEATNDEGVVSQLAVTNLLAEGPLFDLPSGAAHLSTGVEFRTEAFHRQMPARPSFGRDVRSAFGELAIPLLRGRSPSGATGDGKAPASPRVEMSLAGRSERYSDFGATFNPRVGMAAALSRSVKLRGTWGTAFSAPHLVDLYDDSVNHAGLVTLRDPLSADGKSIALVRQGNNESLREEHGRTWTLGLDFAPRWAPGLKASLTYYDIRYLDRIFSMPPAALATALEDGTWAPLITRDPDATAVQAICAAPGFIGDPSQCARTAIAAIVDVRPHNLSSLTMRGLDLNVSRARATQLGEFGFAFNGSYVLHLTEALTATAPTSSVLDTVGNPIARRARAMLDWTQRGASRPGWGASVAFDYSGHYRDTGSRAHPAIESWFTTDLQASYRSGFEGMLGDVEIGLTVNNVFDRDPPFIDREIGYDSFNARPYGRVIGGFVRKMW